MTKNNGSLRQIMSAAVLTLLFFGCAETPIQEKVNKITTGMSNDEYASYINQRTAHDRRYDGIYQVFEISALIVNSDVQNILLLRQGEFLGWDSSRLRLEKDRSAQLMSTQTRAILSFFSPDLQVDDLAKTNSVWRVYLETDGNRYEGKVRKVPGKLPELRNIYPFHNRFSTVYECTFNVPATKIEAASSALIVTGTLGSSRMTFSGLK